MHEVKQNGHRIKDAVMLGSKIKKNKNPKPMANENKNTIKGREEKHKGSA